MSDKFLINANYGPDDAEKATISFILAFTSSKTHETAVFAASSAANALVKNRPVVQAEGYEPLNDLVDGFIQNGGKIWLCPACAKAKGITQDDVIEGVELAGAPKTMAFIESGARVLA